eukprot:c6216_g1_i1.p1 GENE.c6216_g1_i1~~c6216_g1_i1.p1  ORF type:complete len:587 (-),score=129.60 c6216_g1_i1:23-1783(-)
MLLCALVLIQAAPITDETIVSIPGLGSVQGSYVHDRTVIQWLGIPFAAPPVGTLRFAEPKPPSPWGDQILQATQIKPGCPQNCTIMKLACPAVTSEDCLYLNVWAPASLVHSSPKLKHASPPTQKTQKTQSTTDSVLQAFSDSFIPLNLFQEDIKHTTPPPAEVVKPSAPVFVFIHGGMFTLGHSGTALLNGSVIAEKGVVVVTFNYRLGALGFLSYNDIGGNFGFMDQVHALQWVQANIHAFGGDPSSVTLGGQSAGASSVALHMTSEQSDGLFHRVILESPLLGLPLFTQQQASSEIGGDFAYHLGCTQTEAAALRECLQNASVADIVEAQSYAINQVASVRKLFGSPYFSSLILPWAPVINQMITDHPLHLLRQGMWRKTPVIAGFTKDEFASFTPTLVPEFGRYSYSALIYAYFGLRASNRILETYPASDELVDQRTVVSSLTRDMFVACPLRMFTNNNTFPAYLYRFDHVFNDSRLWAEYSEYCAHYACHSSEMAAVFAGRDGVKLTDGVLTEDETVDADHLHRYFVRFIKTGNPNDEVDFQWPKSVGPGPYLRMDTPFTVTPTGVDNNKCDLWDDIGYFW